MALTLKKIFYPIIRLIFLISAVVIFRDSSKPFSYKTSGYVFKAYETDRVIVWMPNEYKELIISDSLKNINNKYFSRHNTFRYSCYDSTDIILPKIDTTTFGTLRKIRDNYLKRLSEN